MSVWVSIYCHNFNHYSECLYILTSQLMYRYLCLILKSYLGEGILKFSELVPCPFVFTIKQWNIFTFANVFSYINLLNSKNFQFCVNLLMTSQWLWHAHISCWLDYCKHINTAILKILDYLPLSNVNISDKQQC